MASKKLNLSKRCLFVLSGVSNALGKPLALEICRRLKPGSLAVLIESSGEDLQEVKKEIRFLENGVNVFSCKIGDWQQADAQVFREMLQAALSVYSHLDFEMALILHNEGTMAMRRLMEPDATESWLKFVQEHLYAAVALNQEFLNLKRLENVEKIVVNMTSSLLVKPFVYSSLNCSCLKARDMYFRSMATQEHRNGVSVLTYSPGIFASHQPEVDANNNTINLVDLEADEKVLKLPRVTSLRSTLKLINILEETSFISGHDVDYYDTFVL